MQKIGIVIPCYNEANRLNETAFIDFLDEHMNSFDFIFVNDGSTDTTYQVLEKLSTKFPDNIKIINQEQNQGKAEAIRIGILSVNMLDYQFLGFWDADLSTPLDEIHRFIDLIKGHNKIKIIIGLRLKRLGANIERSSKRHFFGRIFATFASNILNLPVYDSQCGAKIFVASLVEPLFKEKFITKWIFDVELLARYRNLVGREQLLNSVVEMPLLEWKEVSGSKISLLYLLKVPFELLKINNQYNR